MQQSNENLPLAELCARKVRIFHRASVTSEAGLPAYGEPDEALGTSARAAAASGCPQCAWRKSAADSASALGFSISPDITRSMTATRIAPRKASPPPQILSMSGRERRAATIFDAPSESDPSAGACGTGGAGAAICADGAQAESANATINHFTRHSPWQHRVAGLPRSRGSSPPVAQCSPPLGRGRVAPHPAPGASVFRVRPERGGGRNGHAETRKKLSQEMSWPAKAGHPVGTALT